jgi:hypothetical protein
MPTVPAATLARETAPRVSRVPMAALVGLLAFLAFNANGREIGSTDTQPAKFLAIELASGHGLTLNHAIGRIPLLADRSGFVRDRHGNWRSAYPVASGVAAGAVAWLLSVAHLVDLHAPQTPEFIAKLTSSLLTALAVVWAFLVAARRLPPAWAAGLALALALGTNLWACVSQTLWQQETSMFALMGCLALLDADRPTRRRLFLIGLLLGIAGSARPQVVPTVAVLAIFLLVRHGRRGALALAPLAALAALVVCANLAWFGHPLGAVPALEALHPQIHGVSSSVGRAPWTAAAGLLISPSRGLLVFSPIVLVALAGLSRTRKEGARSELAWCLAAALVQLVAYCFYSVWWGGHTFGPRYALDVLPLLVPACAAGLPAVLARRWSAAAATLALLWSVAVAAAGAFVYPAELWNQEPADVDRAHERLWEWRDSQIPRAWRAGLNPRNFHLVPPEVWRAGNR